MQPGCFFEIAAADAEFPHQRKFEPLSPGNCYICGGGRWTLTAQMPPLVQVVFAIARSASDLCGHLTGRWLLVFMEVGGTPGRFLACHTFFSDNGCISQPGL